MLRALFPRLPIGRTCTLVTPMGPRSAASRRSCRYPDIDALLHTHSPGLQSAEPSGEVRAAGRPPIGESAIRSYLIFPFAQLT